MCHGVTGAPGVGSTWTRQQHRLSGHSCESGVASFTSSRLSYLSVASGSSHDSINRLPEDDESAYASIVNFAELYENGYTVCFFAVTFCLVVYATVIHNHSTWYIHVESAQCVVTSCGLRSSVDSDTSCYCLAYRRHLLCHTAVYGITKLQMTKHTGHTNRNC